MIQSKKEIGIADGIRKKFKNRSWIGQWNLVEEEERLIRKMKIREPESVRATVKKPIN